MPNAALREFASIVVDTTLQEMARTSGASVPDILAAIVADPTGNAARRFREYLALALRAWDEVCAAAAA